LYVVLDQEIGAKQSYLQATLDWIACARDNGYPDIAAPFPVKADDYATEPMAVLPTTMTEQEPRALLAVCPNFDQSGWDNYYAALKELGPDYTQEQRDEVAREYPVGEPNTGFDAPGLNGDHRPGTQTE
jgi:hypothetical protein